MLEFTYSLTQEKLSFGELRCWYESRILQTRELFQQTW